MDIHTFMTLWRAWVPPLVILGTVVVGLDVLMFPPMVLTLHSMLRRVLTITVGLLFMLSSGLVAVVAWGFGFVPTLITLASVLAVILIGDLMIARWWPSRQQRYTIGILWAQSAIAGAIFTTASLPDQRGLCLIVNALLGAGMGAVLHWAYPRSHAAPEG
jgi:hypothetical protein